MKITLRLRILPRHCHIAASLAVIFLTGCHTQPHINYEQIYEEQYRGITSANVFKPRDNTDHPQWFDLAPLIVHETESTDLKGYLPRINDDGTVSTDNNPTVYVHESTATLKNQSHQTITYVWFYTAPPTTNITTRAIRMTLNPEGFPVIWEYLSPDDDVRPIYVARFIESAAEAANQAILKNRRHRVEPAITKHPTIIVPRILADGPVPMGPWVYLDQHHTPITLLCRCMPSQLDNVIADAYYQIRPITDLTALVLDEPLPLIDDLDKPSPIRHLRLPTPQK